MKGYARRSSRVPPEVRQEVKIFLIGAVWGALLMLMMVWAAVS